MWRPRRHTEAARRPAIQRTLAQLDRADLALHLRAHRAAGLPANEATAAIVTMCLNTALTYLLTQSDQVRQAYGLDDLEGFVRRLIETVYPEGLTTAVSDHSTSRPATP